MQTYSTQLTGIFARFTSDRIVQNISPSLEEFICYKATFEHILFMCSKFNKLKVIIVHSIDGNFNLEQLNMERAKLINQRKIDIYVKRAIYQSVKWKNGGETDLKWVTVKRMDLVERNNYFL